MKEQVQRQAETLGIGGAVCMAGVRKDMRQVYSAMDIFALPSLYEGLPMVCLEAQANGLPCLMSDRVTAETAGHAGGGVSAAGSWAGAMVRRV